MSTITIVYIKRFTLNASRRQVCMQANKVTTKNSCARNLYRLLSGISFISKLLNNLAADPKKPLRQAAAEAYDATLSSAHGFMVRTAVKGSMYMLPSREGFLASINETGTTLSSLETGFSSFSLVQVLSTYDSPITSISLSSLLWFWCFLWNCSSSCLSVWAHASLTGSKCNRACQGTLILEY